MFMCPAPGFGRVSSSHAPHRPWLAEVPWRLGCLRVVQAGAGSSAAAAASPCRWRPGGPSPCPSYQGAVLHLWWVNYLHVCSCVRVCMSIWARQSVGCVVWSRGGAASAEGEGCCSNPYVPHGRPGCCTQPAACAVCMAQPLGPSAQLRVYVTAPLWPCSKGFWSALAGHKPAHKPKHCVYMRVWGVGGSLLRAVGWGHAPNCGGRLIVQGSNGRRACQQHGVCIGAACVHQCLRAESVRVHS